MIQGKGDLYKNVLDFDTVDMTSIRVRLGKIFLKTLNLSLFKLDKKDNENFKLEIIGPRIQIQVTIKS